jgi:hypothetical protein
MSRWQITRVERVLDGETKVVVERNDDRSWTWALESPTGIFGEEGRVPTKRRAIRYASEAARDYRRAIREGDPDDHPDDPGAKP